MTFTITSYLIFQILVVVGLLVQAFLLYVVNEQEKKLETHTIALEGIIYALKDLSEGKPVSVTITELKQEDDEDAD